MKEATIVLLGQHPGEQARVDPGSDAEKLYRAKGWRTAEEADAEPKRKAETRGGGEHKG